MVVCPVTGYSGVDISEYCLICGKLNHNQSKTSLKRSEKRKEVNLIGFQDTRVRGGRKGGGRK